MNDQTKASGKQGKKLKIGYGVKVPILSFDDAIEVVEKAGNTIGYEGALDDLSREAGNTPTSSIFTKKLAALKNFGLITVAGDKFYLTELGQGIVNPTSPEQRANAILESLLKIDVHRAIYEKYRGKLLPERTYLANFIHKDLDIPFELKKEWADYFTEAADFTGILHKREGGSFQVMRRPAWEGNNEEKGEATGTDNESGATAGSQVDVSPTVIASRVQQHGIIESSEWGILNQRRVSGDRRAVFAIPDELTKADADGIRTILKGIEASLEGLIKREELLE